MLIDEMKGELHINGSFGVSLGKVTIDNINMVVRNWTDSLIITSIADTGKGSAGPVIVGAMGYKSEARIITLWSQKVVFSSVHQYSIGTSYTDANFNLLWRLDLHSLLKNKKGGIFMSIVKGS